MKENIIHVAPPPAETPLAIVLAGVSFCDETYYIARSNVPQAVLEYIVSGSGSLVVNGELFKPAAGDVYLIPPNTNHYYTSDAKTPWCKLWFNIRGPLLKPLLSAYQLEEQILFHNCPMRPLFEEGLQLLRENALPPEVAGARIIHPILAGLWSFLQHNRSGGEPAKLKDFISSRPGARLSLQELASQSGRSISQTIRIFKKEFQSTPYAENLAGRLETAANLLTTTDLSIKEIALSLGFNNPCYFSRIFHRKKGISPTAYRISSRNAKSERTGYGAGE